jgi:hypothetical protein
VRVAVLGAGGPAGVNVCRALNDAGHEVVGWDEHPGHLVWAAAFCVDTASGPWQQIEADAYYAQPDVVVEHLAMLSDLVTLMPSLDTILACRDKLAASQRWYDEGLKLTRSVVVEDPIPDHLHIAAEQVGMPFWLRASEGAGARGATLVEDLRSGYHWIRYWQTRGVDWSFVADGYLPGRDYCWTSLWHQGVLVAAFARERLEWIYPHLAPSGRTGTPSISQTVHNETVNHVASEAVLAVDDEPNGIYCVDLCENKYRTPEPTEINAGRWATTSPLYSELGVNLPDLHARLAVGEEVEPLGQDIYPAGVRLSRHIDCGHVFTQLPVAA